MRIPLFRGAIPVAVVATLVAFAVSPRASAQELKIAVAADVTSIDPHFFNLFPNNNIDEYTLAFQFKPVK